jgi:FAD-linked sulfhydryl oxidase
MALNQGSGDGRHPCSASKPWWQQPPGALAAGLQHQLQHFASEVQRQAAASSGPRLASLTAGAAAAAPAPPAPLTAADTVAAAASLGSRRAAPKPVDREELGRSTWVLLHTLAAQLPERPSRQQQRDVKALISSLSRVYPCGDCAHHFQQILK